MGSVKQKIVTLDEQINFVKGAIKTLEQIPKSVVEMDQRHVDILKWIADNLHTIKMWVTLPEFHQAAMHVLDNSYELDLQLARKGDKLETSYEVLVRIITKIKYLLLDKEDGQFDSDLEWIASMALIGVQRCIVKNKKEVSNG